MTQAHIGGSLEDGFGEGLTGIRNLSRWNFQDHLRWLAIEFGSGRELGRQLGVPESTLRGWRKGATPRDPYMRNWLIENAREAMMYAHHGRPRNHQGLTIFATIKISGDIRDRTIHVGRHVPGPVIDDVIDRWVVGDDQGAAGDLTAAIRHYYAPVQMTKVRSVRWSDGY